MPSPSQGETWLANLDPVVGREQAGKRPVVVISIDPYNRGPADLVVALPLTTVDKHVPLHVAIDPPEGGVMLRSFVKCDDIRSISVKRLMGRWGSVSSPTMALVEDRPRVLHGL
jgi:mRNA interferase MazF